jgi:hypothetical protein
VSSREVLKLLIDNCNATTAETAVATPEARRVTDDLGEDRSVVIIMDRVIVLLLLCLCRYNNVEDDE